MSTKSIDTANYNGPWADQWKAGSATGLADGVLQPDWRKCCGR
ncbi:hypothetical protein [Streptomyces sp. CBMA156]|nr:hypothetical protein [Streptomyces sp. CBMA156]